jgi:hypothetical protein
MSDNYHPYHHNTPLDQRHRHQIQRQPLQQHDPLFVPAPTHLLPHQYPSAPLEHLNEAYYPPPLATSASPIFPPIHLYPPPISNGPLTRPPAVNPEPMGFLPAQYDSSMPVSEYEIAQGTSPYMTPVGFGPMTAGSGGSGSHTMTEYFPPYNDPSTSGLPTQPEHLKTTEPFTSSSWQSAPPASTSRPKVEGSRGGNPGAKTSRQQFTACGACRHRRVRCDLKDRQEEAEASGSTSGQGIGAHRSNSGGRRKKISCTNCTERGTNCV